MHGYGPCDYRDTSLTTRWIRHAVSGMVDRLVAERRQSMDRRVAQPPRHLNTPPRPAAGGTSQPGLFD